jgi:integrase/recombinase XerD
MPQTSLGPAVQTPVADGFSKFLFIQKGLQPVTVHGHVSAIGRITRKVGTLTKESAENYVLSLYQSSYSYSQKANEVKAIEYWFGWRGEPLAFGRQQKPKPIVKQVLSEAEVTKLLFSCKNVRERAIIATLAYSGIRPKELTNLKLQDIDFGTNELRVIQGKGMKDAVIYVSAACARILLEYLVYYPKKGEDPLFTTADGKRPFNPSALRKLAKVLAKRANLTKRMYPYLLRHSLASAMFARGADILTVKHQLRHAWIETTELYIHSIGYCPKNKYEQYAPSYV